MTALALTRELGLPGEGKFDVLVEPQRLTRVRPRPAHLDRTGQAVVMG
jgi:hypothetical protein